jgi:hypothetical protein
MTSAGQQPTATLTDKLRVPPATADDSDARTELSELPGAVGLAGNDCGGYRRLPRPRPHAAGILAPRWCSSIASAAKSVAIRDIWPICGDRGQGIAMDLRVAPHRLYLFYVNKWSCSTAAHSMTPRVDDALATARSIREMISDGRSR